MTTLHTCPRPVRFGGSLPVGPGHKVLKRELRKTFATGGQQGG